MRTKNHNVTITGIAGGFAVTIEQANNEIADDAAELLEIAALIEDIENINGTQLRGLRTRYFEGIVTGSQMVHVRNEEGRRAR